MPKHAISAFGILFCLLLVSCGRNDASPSADPLAAPEMRAHAPEAVKIGWEYFEKGDLDTALSRFEMAVRHDPTFAPGYYGIAYVHSVRGELDAAVKFYRLTLQHDQSNPYTFANLGYALLQQEKYDEALPMLDKALELKPDCGEAHLSYANYYASQGDWKNAEVSVNKALRFGMSLHPELKALLEKNGVTLRESGP